MKISAVCISVTLVALATSILPADAADWNNGAGSIKDRGQAGVPVPIPEAYQETYKYYLRGDLGFTPKSSAKVTVLGAPLSLLPEGDWERNAFVGFGFGRYVTPSLRLEFGIDLRPKHKVAAGGAKFTATQAGDGGTKTIVSGSSTLYSGPSLNYNQYNVSREDEATISNQTGLVNLVYDIKTGSRFTPYIGAGLGVSLHTMLRTGKEDANCFQGYNDVQLAYGQSQPFTCYNQTDLKTRNQSSDFASRTSVGLAAALMAGVSFDISERTHWEFGYRALWHGGLSSVSFPSVAAGTTIRIDSQVDHELRTGLRFDLW